jgi:type III pantothenate kinase
MLLCVDVGNTNIEFGLFDGGRLCAKFRLTTDSARTADEIGLSIAGFFDHFQLDMTAIGHIVGSLSLKSALYIAWHIIRHI